MKIHKVIYLFSALLLLSINVCKAGHESYTSDTNRVFTPGDTFSVRDYKLGTEMCSGGIPTTYSFYIKNVEDRVSLNLNYLNKAYFNQAFTVTYHLQITYFLSTDCGTFPVSGSQVKNISLTVKYDPAKGKKHIDEDVFKFNGAHKFIVRIMGVDCSLSSTVLPLAKLQSIVKLDGYIDVERYYKMTSDSTTNILSLNADSTKIKVQWKSVPFAEQYDLEWMWVDSFKNKLYTEKLVFIQNASRVTLNAPQCSYTIPLTYEKGYLVFRIRPIGRGNPNFSTCYGKWSLLDNTMTLTDLGFPSGTPVSYAYQVNKNYGSRFNWESSLGLVEEGKQKVLVNFVDGSSKVRQSITKSFTYDQVIISETIYDHVGRPGITTLPIPVTTDSQLCFHPGFTLDSLENPYSWEDFERGNVTDTCSITKASYLHNTGAGQYYSSANPYTDFNAYVPNAFGYPFTQIEYTNDNTGRTRRQGGVGPQHQLGSGHETKLYYGLPNQLELDKMFGSDVGHFTRYKKNMAIDPNGQISISYMDAHGRVVATSLAGGGAANLEPLDSNISPASLSSTEIIDTTISSLDNSYTSTLNYTFPVEKAGTRTFTYELKPEKFDDFCNPKPNICYDCVYDLQIMITNECGQIIAQSTRTIGKLPADTLCGNNLDTAKPVLSVYMNVGQYTVHKTLKINDSALNYYTQKYIDQDSCLSYDAVYALELGKINFAGCKGCPSCDADSNGRDGSLRGQLYRMLTGDVSPGGQYALYADFDSTGATIDYNIPLSVLNCNGNQLPKGTGANWRHPVTPYLEPDGSMSYVEYKGVSYRPEQLPDEGVFINSWKMSWANSLLPYHPEYPYYQWFNIVHQCGSDAFDSLMLATNSFSKAKSLGLFNPLGGLHYNTSVFGTTSHLDPFFSDTTGVGFLQSFRSYLDSYQVIKYFFARHSFSAWDLAIVAAHCNDNNPNILGKEENRLKCLDNYVPGDSCTDDKAWQVFRAIYLQKKRLIQNILVNDYAILHKGYNQCIGLNENNPDFADDFYFYTMNMSGQKIAYDGVPAQLYAPYRKLQHDPQPENDATQPCSRVMLYKYAHKTRRYDPKVVLFGVDLSGDPAEIVKEMQDSTAGQAHSSCQSQCEAFANQWMNDLSGCAAHNGGHWDKSNAIYNGLRDTLIQICTLGCDGNNPFGASSIAPGASFKYRTFDDAIHGVLKFYGFDSMCTALAIDVPKSYGHNYGLGTPPASTCGDGTAGNGGSDPNPFYHYNDNCIYCEELREAMTDFTVNYSMSSSNPQYERYFENFMNSRLNKNLTYQKFMDMVSDCNAHEPIPQNCLISEDTVRAVTRLLDSLVTHHAFADDSSYFDLALLGTAYTSSPDFQMLFGIEDSCKPAMKIIDNQPYGNLWEADIRSACDFSCRIILRVPATSKSPTDPTVTYPATFDMRYITGINTIIPYPTGPGAGHTFTAQVTYHDPHYLNSDVINTTVYQLYGETPCWNLGHCSGNTPKQAICSPENLSNEPYTQPNWSYHYVLEAQPPYDYFNHRMYDSCGCNELFDVYDAYKRGGGGGTGTASFAEYYNGHFHRKPGDTTGSNALRQCLGIKGLTPGTFDTASVNSYKHPWSSTQQDALNNAAPTMPIELGCDQPDGGADGPSIGSPVCENCQEIAREFAAIKNNYRNVVHDSTYFASLSQTLSYRFNKTLYAIPAATDSASSCKACTQPGLAICTNISTQGLWLEFLMDSMATRHGLLLNPWNITHSFAMKYLKPTGLSCDSFLYLGNLPVPEANHFRFAVASVPYCGLWSDTVDLYSPDTAFDFNKLRHFRNMRPINGVDGDNYQFSIQATDDSGNVYTLTGKNDYYPISSCCTYKPLCEDAQPKKLTVDTSYCRRSLLALAKANADFRYKEYQDSIAQDFKDRYTKKCMGAHQSMMMQYYQYTYQTTLYYYDQAGNLVKTVPPKGVKLLSDADALNVDKNRANSGSNPEVRPSHVLTSTYEYNSLNEPEQQNTPDAGGSQYWYDNLGRIIASQSARQQPLHMYSYTIYDALGRIKEVGEVHNDSAMRDTIAKNPAYVIAWLAFGSRHQVTRTYYDAPVWPQRESKIFAGKQRLFLRNRVTSTTYSEIYGPDTVYTHGTHYCYDEHGNVNRLVQEFPELDSMLSRYKRIDYTYDLISGKVRTVDYQAGCGDQWHHRYEYDPDDRLQNVYTSTDSVLWDKDAAYFYYRHGPLARTKLGRLNVQGIDYTYTIHGWIKGMNSDMLDESVDPGQDGRLLSTTGHRWVARDAVGYSLSYYTDDYSPAGGTAAFWGVMGYGLSGIMDASVSRDLFNGNIARMTTGNAAFMPAGTHTPIASGYLYDQLNRLKLVTAFNNYDHSSNLWQSGSAGMGKYRNAFTYDMNGNILTQLRDGDGSGTGGSVSMDQLTYYYTSGTNKLDHVEDAVSATAYPDDIDNQAPVNYSYDASGNLISDNAELIDSIKWNAYGKVTKVHHNAGSGKTSLEFAYGPDGQRWVKLAKPDGKNASAWVYTYYVRDAEGNVMATYTRALRQDLNDSSHITDSLTLRELDMYGSSRLGLDKIDTTYCKRDFNGNVDRITGVQTITHWNYRRLTVRNDSLYWRKEGRKRYELTNHLGNVLATISDRHIAQPDSVYADTVGYYTADIITAQDYYAFGAPMPGRKYVLDSMPVPRQLVYKADTCVTCRQLKTKLYAYMTAYSDTGLLLNDSLAAYMNRQYGMWQSAENWYSAMKSCKMIRDVLTQGGTSSAIDHGNHTQYMMDSGAFTVEAWYQFDGNTAQGRSIAGKLWNSGGEGGYMMNVINGKLQLLISDGNEYLITGNTVMSKGWHHLVVQRSAAPSYTYKLYVDNVLQTNSTSGLLVNRGNTNHVNTAGFTIGESGYNGTRNPMNGSVRQVRLYKRVISATEVSASYNSGCGADPSDTSNLVLWDKFEEGMGTAWYTSDASHYNQTGFYLGSTSLLIQHIADTSCIINGTAICQHQSPVGCLACQALGNAMLKYSGSYTDTAAIATYLNAKYSYSQTAHQWMQELRDCKLANYDLDFNQSGDADMGDHSQWHFGTGNFSLETWVYFKGTVASTVQGLISTESGSNAGWVLGYDANGRIDFNIHSRSHGGSTESLHTNFSPSQKKWHHVVMEKNGNVGGNFKMYIDGKRVYFGVYNAGMDSKPLSWTDVDSGGISTLKIGSHRGGNNGFGNSNVKMRQVRIYNRLLSDAEVAGSYNSGCGADPVDTTGLKLWCPLNEGSGDTVHDWSHYRQNGGLFVGSSGFEDCYAGINPNNCTSGTAVCSPGLYTMAADGYRYGFDGQEKDNDVYGEGDAYTAEFWEYDPRLGRRWNVDPMPTDYQSPYVTFDNDPIFYKDPSGAVAGGHGGQPLNSANALWTYGKADGKNKSLMGRVFAAIGNAIHAVGGALSSAGHYVANNIQIGVSGEKIPTIYAYPFDKGVSYDQVKAIVKEAQEIWAKNGFNVRFKAVSRGNIKLNPALENIYQVRSNGLEGENNNLPGNTSWNEEERVAYLPKTYINFTQIKFVAQLNHATDKDLIYAYGYVLAHEALHFYRTRAYVYKHHSEVPGKMEHTSCVRCEFTPNLNMDEGDLISTEGGGIPVGSSPKLRPAETILPEHVSEINEYFDKILSPFPTPWWNINK